MSMLTDQIDLVIGIDTLKRTHTAAFVDRLGAVHEVFEVEANAAGCRRLLRVAMRTPGSGCGRWKAPVVTAPVSRPP